MIRAPSSGWLRITTHSAAVSGPSLRSTASGTPILPMSCRSAAWSTIDRARRPTRPSSRAITHRRGGNAARMAGRVRVARVDRRRQRLEGRRRALDHRAMGLLERRVLLDDRLARLLQPQHGALREVDEEERRERESCERKAVAPEVARGARPSARGRARSSRPPRRAGPSRAASGRGRGRASAAAGAGSRRRR